MDLAKVKKRGSYSNIPAISKEGSLTYYLQQIKKFPLLGAEEEYMLAKSWKDRGDLKSAEKLVTSHLRLVASIAMGYKGYGLPVAELVSETGAEVWAHDIYAHLQVYDPRLIMRTAASPLQQEMRRVADNNGSFPSESPERDNYIATRKALKIDHPIQHNEMIGNLTLLFTPGHSPDELCMSLDGVVFTGDHVLPEISPHPTMKTNFSPDIRNNLPGQYQDASKWYGLETYLKSLKVVSDLGEGVQVLPAHRYFNRDHFNFINTGRARDIIQHHGERLAHIVEKLNGGEMGLEDLTRGIFEHRKLESDNLLAGLSEIVAHVEVLEDLGDVEVIDGIRIIRTGQSNHREFIDGLVS